MNQLLSLVTVFALATLAAAAPIGGDKGGATSVPFLGGVADADGKRGYVTAADGGIDALDLENGKVLWHSKDAQKPIALAGKLVLAQATVKPNVVRVVGLDAEGKKTFESDPITFPDWVSVGIDYGRSFMSVSRTVDGDLWLRWNARAWYAGGARPTKEIEERARKNADGVVRVNLKSGKIEMLARDKEPAEKGPKVPAEVEKLAARDVWDGSGMVKRVQTIGKLAVAVDMEADKVVLRRWDLASGKAQEPLTLLDNAAVRTELAPAAGCVLVCKAPMVFGMANADDGWYVFDLVTGKERGKFAIEAGYETATVVGQRAYYVVQGGRKGPRDLNLPRTLKAVDLKTGKVAWSHEIEPRRMLIPRP